jgi:hypothetical protein
MSELAGPLGGVLRNFQDAMSKAQRGDVIGGMNEVAPSAIKNLLKGAGMMASGNYKDARGYKVDDVTAAESFGKMLGFQPGSIAKETRKMMDEMQDKSLTVAMEGVIADKWARGVFEKDYKQVLEARRTLKAWNDNNPETPIVIKPVQIATRVKNMNKTRAERFLGTVPKEMRKNVALELQ